MPKKGFSPIYDRKTVPEIKLASRRKKHHQAKNVARREYVVVRTWRKTACSGELPQTRPYKSMLFYCNEVGFGHEIVREQSFPDSGSIIGFG